jgi:hypothetical protein
LNALRGSRGDLHIVIKAVGGRAVAPPSMMHLLVRNNGADLAICCACIDVLEDEYVPVDGFMP